MTESEKKDLLPRRDGRFARGAKRVLQLLAMLIIVMVAAMGMAHWSVNHPYETAALRGWVYNTRYGWLFWRLVLYAVLTWGFWKIWHAQGVKPEHHQSLKRMAIACTVFALACEYSVFGGGLTL
ncbi:hypothetical protein RJ492_004509 [Pluralibacter gergoviae]|uniref:hypothetical protein n=1 Tax=Enterobacterales TaxID=91347 RepID=UPI0007CC0764|nr:MULTISPECIES: hypothetical protein [Enterobacterales]EKV9909450.1 hypothetical protein [Pluralibacter gergoviae]SAQ03437.1 Uncharacterised protein [Klebsiella oxytoca]HBX4000052.1 hypothetical protein [Klebsiella variicola]ELD4333504.1 hypothetical protein [Pluralibacter gergoviae]MBZ6860920.1 hypothetical protein [Klebsiella michiganensis]